MMILCGGGARQLGPEAGDGQAAGIQTRLRQRLLPYKAGSTACRFSSLASSRSAEHRHLAEGKPGWDWTAAWGTRRWDLGQAECGPGPTAAQQGPPVHPTPW